MIYIIIFATSIFLSIITCAVSKRNKKIGYLFLTSIIILLSLFGGMRDYTIGTDIRVYGLKWFQAACLHTNLWSYISVIDSSDTAYLVLNYVVSRFSNNPSTFFFTLQLIVNSLVIITLYRYKDKLNFPIAILIYLCLFYCRTFNLLRQSLALSICFYSYYYFDKNKNFKFIMYTLIASLFHFTAVFNLVLLILKKICNLEGKKKYIMIFIVFIATFVMTLFIEKTISILYSFGLVNIRIYNYLTKYSNNGSFINLETLFRMIMIAFLGINIKQINKKVPSFNLMFLCTLMEFMLFQTRTVILYADRISLYFGYLFMIVLPLGINNCTKSNRKKMIINIFFMILLIFYWYYIFAYRGSCEVYPFKFYWN